VGEINRQRFIQLGLKELQDDAICIYDGDVFNGFVCSCNWWKMMHNKLIEFMKKKIEASNAVDVSVIGRQVEPGLYYLGKFIDGGYDYFDTKTGEFIYSIGIDQEGNIWAANDSRFYMSPDYECLWLR